MNPGRQFSQQDLRKTTEYWTETRAKKLIQTGKLLKDENKNQIISIVLKKTILQLKVSKSN